MSIVSISEFLSCTCVEDVKKKSQGIADKLTQEGKEMLVADLESEIHRLNGVIAEFEEPLVNEEAYAVACKKYNVQHAGGYAEQIVFLRAALFVVRDMLSK